MHDIHVHTQDFNHSATRADGDTAGSVIAEFVALALTMISVVLVIHYDAAILGNAISETSVTESMQSALVFGSALTFAYAAVRFAILRGYLCAVATLLMALFIRENDFLLDQIVHGFWIIPAIVTVAIGGALSWRNRQTFAPGVIAHLGSRSGTLFALGLVTLIVFSRLFGTGALWQGILGAGYDPYIKTVVQEGVELLGHALVFHAAILSLLLGFGTKTARR